MHAGGFSESLSSLIHSRAELSTCWLNLLQSQDTKKFNHSGRIGEPAARGLADRRVASLLVERYRRS